jgi:hypothetical protein
MPECAEAQREGRVRYSRHLDYLRALILHLGSSEKQVFWTPKQLAKALSLDIDRLAWVLTRFPTLFIRKPARTKVRGKPAAGGSESAPSEPPGKFGNWFRTQAVDLLGRRPPPAAERGDVGFALLPALAGKERSRHERPLDPGAIRTLLDLVDRSADAERRALRFGMTLLVALFLALLLIARLGGVEVTATGSGIGNSSAVAANTAQAGAPGGPGMAIQCACSKDNCPPCTGTGSVLLRIVIVAVCFGISIFCLLWLRETRERKAKAVLSLASVAGFGGAIWAGAKPYLVVGLAPAMHDSLAAGFVGLLVIGGLLLISGFLIGQISSSRLKLLFWIPALPLILGGPIMFAGIADYDFASFARGLTQPFVGASLAQRIYATVLALGAALAFLATFGFAGWMSGISWKGGGSNAKG